MSYSNISFAGIGRIKDQLVLASVFDRLTSQERNEIEASFQGILSEALSKFSPGSREKKQFSKGILYLLADKELSCVYGLAVRDKTYPERVAFSFLGEFVAAVAHSESGRQLNVASRPGTLTKDLRKPLKELMDKYDQPSKVDKTIQAQGKVDHVKEIMQDNLTKVIATHANISELEGKTDSLNVSAQQFQQNTNELQRKMWWQKMRITILLGVLCTAVVIYVIVMIVRWVR